MPKFLIGTPYILWLYETVEADDEFDAVDKASATPDSDANGHVICDKEESLEFGENCIGLADLECSVEEIK